MYVINTLCNIL